MYDLHDLPTRLANKIVPDENGCWIWTGHIGKTTGYGRCSAGNGDRTATDYVHRLVYRLLVGRFDTKLSIDHLCRVRACCNPAHLEPVPIAENIRRAYRHITHCPMGHEYTPENTALMKRGNGRQCRACRPRWRKPKAAA